MQHLKRIAFVSDAVYPFNKGGKEVRLYQIAHRLAARGHDVHVYTMKWWDGEKVLHLEGVAYHAITRLHPLYSGERRSIKQALLFAMATLRLLGERFDVLDVDHMPFFPLFTAKVVCSLRHKPLFGTWHEVWGRDYWRSYLGPFGWAANVVEQLAFTMPDRIISNSEHTTTSLRQSRPGIRVETVPLGADLDLISAVAPSSYRSDLIFAGRLLSNKNIALLLRAVAVMVKTQPDLRCLIVGEGPERKALERLADELLITRNTEFCDFFDEHIDLFALMKASKVFVLPSEREGFGLVVIEANACGLPVVTVKHPSNAAQDLIVEGNNGVIAEVDRDHLARSIRYCLDHREEMPVLQTLHERLPQCGWDRITSRIEEILVGGEPPPSPDERLSAGAVQ